ncbi:MAG: hypothetical protein KDH20_15855 [Rhodocyclaceae bacterium]|nr:hypothetical protein [Rhodocyclaceae bacterium]
MTPTNCQPVAVIADRQQTLDQLWHEAEQLGEVSVDRNWRGKYKVEIRFERKSGTTIYARGEDPVIAFALANAINEAREMGAGTEA